MPRWIDLRYELRCLINGDHRTVPQGYWIVLRIMRIGQYSEYWDERRKEAVNGPKWLYDDFTVRNIANPGATLANIPKLDEGAKAILRTGLDNINTRIFAVEWSDEFPRAPIEGEDIIYEIAEYSGIDRPTPPLTATGRYRVLNVIRDHGDYGRAEVFYLLAQRMHGEE